MIIRFLKGAIFGIMTFIAFICFIIILICFCEDWKLLFDNANQCIITLICSCGFLGGYFAILGGIK